MIANSRVYDDWKAPREHGQMLIWPEPEQILAQTRANAHSLGTASQTLVQKVPLPELRRGARRFIGHIDNDKPLIATGHQTELNHPGVWVKNALMGAVAWQCGGSAFHFAVDTDAPKHLHLRWPGGSWSITDDPALNGAPWSSLVAPPSPRYLAAVQSAFDQSAVGWSFTPHTEIFFSHLRRSLLEVDTLPTALTSAIHAAEWDLGLRHHAMLVSPMWLSEPYLVLVHHLIASIETFAPIYNSSLAEYRQKNGVTTSSRPMPDLDVSADQCELPFWVDDMTSSSRTRARADRSANGRWELRVVDRAGTVEPFTFDPSLDGWKAAGQLLAWLRRHNLRLAPRALTLTLFFRLLLADQFVHGIGGGRYDQVTDAIIARFFGIEPPHFSVTTAPMFFPMATEQKLIDLRPLLQEGRRIRHGMLSREKRNLVAQIGQLPRLSRERRELFFDMHRKLAAESDSPAIRKWETDFRAAQHLSAEQRPLFDRELFFAIQPRERLIKMIARYDVAFGR